MSVINFTQDELVVLAMYDDAGMKDEVIDKLKEALPYVDDLEMVAIMESAIEKLEEITEMEYLSLNIDAYKNLFDDEEDDRND